VERRGAYFAHIYATGAEGYYTAKYVGGGKIDLCTDIVCSERSG